jgi:mannose-6-phosphate isomerase
MPTAPKVSSLHQRSQDWLAQDAIPLWLGQGIDWKQGGFFEALSPRGEALEGPKRSMVQARQIYSFKTASELQCVEKKVAHHAIAHGLKFMLDFCSLPSGAFMHAVDRDGKPHQTTPDLYAQAFALFGLAQAFSIEPASALRDRAKALVDYLQRERKTADGGYFELKGAERLYQSNPQMHLFEAALAWMDVDSDPAWRKLADEMASLCLEKFIDRESGVLGEHFEAGWTPVRDPAGEKNCFMFEPGHQYEWAWLLGRYQKHTGKDLSAARFRLFERSERNGICPDRKTAFDELWSDMRCKTATSRFWPQCERIKAAVQLGNEASQSEREGYYRAADEALSALFRFLETPKRGLWFDRCSTDFAFIDQPAKASSLYHIIGAMNEYLAYRPARNTD